MLTPQVAGDLAGAALRVAGPPASSARSSAPTRPTTASKVDTGGYRVITTLDWKHAEDRREVGLRRGAVPERQEPARRSCASRKIPAQRVDLDPRPARPQHPQRGRRRSSTTGPARSSPTSAARATPPRATRSSSPSSTSSPTAGASPGRRSSRSTTDRHRRQDADRGDDVHGRRHRTSAAASPRPRPTSSSAARSGSARRSSSRSTSRPSRPTLISGLDHIFERDQGLRAQYLPEDRARSCRWASARSRSTRSTCSAPTARSPTAACRCRARRSLKVARRRTASTSGRTRRRSAEGERGRSARRPPTSSPTSSPATPTRRSTRSGASGRSTTARRAGRPPTRPARRATTATSHAYGYLAPPKDKKAPALAVGVWMGNSDNSPNDGKLSLDTSAPLWSAILTEVSKGTPIAKFKPPPGLETATVDAFTGLQARARSRRRRSRSSSSRARSRRRRRRSGSRRRSTRRPACSGRTAASGRRSPRGFFNLSEVEANFPNWQKANRNWAARAATGSGVRGGPKGTRTAYFYDGGFAPFGGRWGAPFAPTQTVPARRPVDADPPPTCDAPIPPPSAASRRPSEPPGPDNDRPSRGNANDRSGPPSAPAVRARRSSPRRRPRRARPGADRLHQRMAAGLRRGPRRAGRPSPGRG